MTFARMERSRGKFPYRQNRDLLEKLSEQTGGQYWNSAGCPNCREKFHYSDAGITVRDTKEPVGYAR